MTLPWPGNGPQSGGLHPATCTVTLTSSRPGTRTERTVDNAPDTPPADFWLLTGAAYPADVRTGVAMMPKPPPDFKGADVLAAFTTRRAAESFLRKMGGRGAGYQPRPFPHQEAVEVLRRLLALRVTSMIIDPTLSPLGQTTTYIEQVLADLARRSGA